MTKRELEEKIRKLEKEIEVLKNQPKQEVHHHYHYNCNCEWQCYYPTFSGVLGNNSSSLDGGSLDINI